MRIRRGELGMPSRVGRSGRDWEWLSKWSEIGVRSPNIGMETGIRVGSGNGEGMVLGYRRAGRRRVRLVGSGQKSLP